MDKNYIKRIVYGVLIYKLPYKQYLEIPRHIISAIADDIIIELKKEGIINV